MGEIIKLIAGEGESKATFSIHRSVLCASSPFFEAACKPQWMKPDDRLIKLPEDDPEAIQLLVYWMYHDEICFRIEITERLEGATMKQQRRQLCVHLQNFMSSGRKIRFPESVTMSSMPYLAGEADGGLSLGRVPYV